MGKTKKETPEPAPFVDTEELRKTIKKRLKKTLDRKPTVEEVDAKLAKKLKKLAAVPKPVQKKSKKEKKEKKNTDEVAAAAAAAVSAAAASAAAAKVAQAAKKPKKSKKEKKVKKEKRKASELAEDSVRLDWTEVRFKGKDGDAQKNKFLRLMGDKTHQAVGNGATTSTESVVSKAKPGGVIAALSQRVAPKNKTLFGGLFSGKAGGGGAAVKVNVNTGTTTNKFLLQQAESAQALLQRKQRNGGKMGFSM